MRGLEDSRGGVRGAVRRQGGGRARRGPVGLRLWRCGRRLVVGALVGAAALLAAAAWVARGRVGGARPAASAAGGQAAPLPATAAPPVGAPRLARDQVACETTKGNFSIVLRREWAPRGHDRFVELVETGFFDNQLVYRALPGFLVQFGVAADPAVQARWDSADARIPDDPQQHIPFTAGTVSFAGSGKDSRSCHVFFSLEPHGKGLGAAEHERPFGRIEDPAHQRVIESFFSGYGDLTSLQGAMVRAGNAAAARYPLLDRIERCRYHRAASVAGGAVPAVPAGIVGSAARGPGTVWLHVQGGVGSVPIHLHEGAPGAAARLAYLAAKNTSGRLHRAEPLPPPGSSGPPYALVQFSLHDPALAGLPHEGDMRISRGAVCLIGRSSDLFVSLARHGEHVSWSSSMTVVGHVHEEALSSHLEARVLALPKHTFKHPEFGTVMSMLDRDLPCSLRLAPLAELPVHAS